MRVLGLDLSTHAGWALLEGEPGSIQPSAVSLVQYGTLHLGKSIFEFGDYPWSYYLAAAEHAGKLGDLITEIKPDVIVIEELNLGRNRGSQRILHEIHAALVRLLYDMIWVDHYLKANVYYVDSSAWRHNLGLTMSKEQKKANAKLRKEMRKAKASNKKVNKKSLGIKGLVTPKHLAINYVNDKFRLQLKVKDNDTADAVCLGLSFLNGVSFCNGL